MKFTASSGSYIRPGTWRLKLDPGTDPHPDVHIWSYWGTDLDSQRLDDPDFEFGWAKEDDGPGMELRWRRRKEWIESTLRGEATSREAIAAGAAIWDEDDKIMVPYRPSSRGPATEAGRLAADLKPDLVAPGSDIVVALWRKPKHPTDPSSVSTRESGTSFASPAIAGAATLMLSHDPSLNQDDVRKILRASTSAWAPLVKDAQAQLSGSLGRLLAISENYPNLKSNQNFLALQSQLEGTENLIAVARHDYIEAVRVYNTELRTFPGSVWARIFYTRNKPMEEFTVADSVKTPPQVKF